MRLISKINSMDIFETEKFLSINPKAMDKLIEYFKDRNKKYPRKRVVTALVPKEVGCTNLIKLSKDLPNYKSNTRHLKLHSERIAEIKQRFLRYAI